MTHLFSPSMQRLLWKDYRSIRLLGIAMAVGLLAFNLIALIYCQIEQPVDGSAEGLSLSIWGLLPYLFALGAGPMLVGNEEENGTFAWLRFLPISWKQIPTSQLAVSLGWLVALWMLATMLLGLQYVTWAHGNGHSFSESMTRAILGPGAIFLYYSLLLLLISFVVSYFFKSPITAVLVTFPAMALVSWVLNAGAEFILRLAGHRTHLVNVGVGQGLLLAIAAGLFLLSITGLMYFVARRRFLGSPRALSEHFENFGTEIDALSILGPPSPACLTKPSVVGALLWHQARQTLPIALPAIILIGACCLFTGMISGDQLGGVELMFFIFFPLMLTFSTLGAMTFYGDSIRRRCQYFADRGISPNRVWASRVLVSAAYLMIGLIAIASLTWTSQYSFFILIKHACLCAALAWGIGVWVSLVTPRPILAFFWAPLVVALLQFPVFGLCSEYPTYSVIHAWPVPLVLLATWRLCRPWIDGQINGRFYGRAIGYLALAIAIPWGTIIAHRYITMPPVDQPWRSKMMAMELPGPSQPDEGHSHGILPSAHKKPRASTKNRRSTELTSSASHAFLDQLKAELEEKHLIGIHVSFSELEDGYERERLAGNPEVPSVIQRLIVEVWLAWARESRQRIIEGPEGVKALVQVAEPSEQNAANAMLQWKRTEEINQELSRLTAMILPDDIREKSRVIAITRDWRWFQDHRWNADSITGKPFGSMPLLSYSGRLRVEQKRSERFLDQAIKLALQQIHNQEYFSDPNDRLIFSNSWFQAVHGPSFTAISVLAASQHGYNARGDNHSMWLHALFRMGQQEDKIANLRHHSTNSR